MTLNELEIIKIAKQIEEAGMEFYEKYKNKFESKEIKVIFEFLIRQEKSHSEKFDSLYRELDRDTKVDIKGMDDYTNNYIKALGETSVFNTYGLMGIENFEVKNPRDIILLGIQAEKDSILYYESIRKNTYNEKTKEIIGKIIEQEVEHLIKLRRVIDRIT